MDADSARRRPYLIPSAATRKYIDNPVVVLNEDTFIVGRSPDADLVINSPYVSRVHAVFKRGDRSWTATDNESLIGLFINGVKLGPFVGLELSDGDTIRFGPRTMSDEIAFKFAGENQKGYSGLDKVIRANERLEEQVKRLKGELRQYERQEEAEKRQKFEMKKRAKQKMVAKLLANIANERRNGNGKRNNGKEKRKIRRRNGKNRKNRKSNVN